MILGFRTAFSRTALPMYSCYDSVKLLIDATIEVRSINSKAIDSRGSKDAKIVCERWETSIIVI